jgi:hypothetical protein
MRSDTRKSMMTIEKCHMIQDEPGFIAILYDKNQKEGEAENKGEKSAVRIVCQLKMA